MLQNMRPDRKVRRARRANDCRRCNAVRVTLIANPVSGCGRSLKAARAAEPVLAAAGWAVETVLTTCPGDATRLAREAAARGVDAVFACGGDGTFSQVVTGLLDTGVPAGVIPAGTGNDFARAIRLPLTPREAAQSLVSGRAAPTDLIAVNQGALWAVNIIGLGFDARVCERINARRRVLGGLPAYLVALAGEFASYRPTQVSLQSDNGAWEGPALLVAVANSESYGSGMRIAPRARIDDGLMDVVVVRYMSRLAFVRAFPLVLKGTHLDHPAVMHWQAREVEVRTDPPSPFLCDGDLAGHSPVHLRMAPGRARVWLPG
jgi:diacylglycerol kinase (ATP)